MHPKIWCYFLAPRFIKNTVNSYSCIKRTPSFDVQFWGKKSASYTRDGTVTTEKFPILTDQRKQALWYIRYETRVAQDNVCSDSDHEKNFLCNFWTNVATLLPCTHLEGVYVHSLSRSRSTEYGRSTEWSTFVQWNVQWSQRPASSIQRSVNIVSA